MKFLNGPRQPFVGLSLMAAIGIVVADGFCLPEAALIWVTIFLAMSIVIAAWRPTSLVTYIIVGLGDKTIERHCGMYNNFSHVILLLSGWRRVKL